MIGLFELNPDSTIRYLKKKTKKNPTSISLARNKTECLVMNGSGMLLTQ